MKKIIKSNSFVDLSFVHSLEISPNGDYLVYAVSQADEEKNSYNSNLWAYHVDEKRHFQLTSSNQDSNFIFLDETRILLKRKDVADKENKEDKKTHYQVIDLRGGETRSYMSIDLVVSKLLPINEDQFILTAGEFPNRDEGFHEIERLPFWLNGSNFIYDQNSYIYLYDRSNNETTKLSEDDLQIGNIELSKDKKTLLFSGSYHDPHNFFNALYTLSLEDKKIKQITDEDMSHSFFDFINNDQVIYLAKDMKKHGLNQDPFVYAVALDGSNKRQISQADFDMAFGNSTGTDIRFGATRGAKVYGDKLYFISTVRDRAKLFSIDLDGKVEIVVDDVSTVESFDIKGDTLVYSAIDGLSLAELYLKNDQGKQKLTDFSKVLNDYQLSEIEHFVFENDGHEFDGYVIKPSNYEPGKSYPALLEIHGGPKTAYAPIMHHEMQLLANQGYFVFFTNPRGSSGRGIEFSDIRGKYGTIDYQDLMTFTDKVLEKYPDIDPTRLGVLGGSYGGFMTNWIISHTDRFKAANTQRSISNWTSFFGVSDIGYYFAKDQNQASPWDNFDLLWERSPLKHLNKAKTPTLVIHSDQDYRCPLEQGLQVYTALKLNDIDTKLVIFNGETHELSRSGKPKNRIKRLNEILSWFDKYLKNDDQA